MKTLIRTKGIFLLNSFDFKSLEYSFAPFDYTIPKRKVTKVNRIEYEYSLY